MPAMNFLMVDGEGDPNTAQSFQDAINVLYPLSYALKFMIKKGEIGIDYEKENNYSATNVIKDKS